MDKVNGVISIDIGIEVGVKKGQEFFVFPPDYDGETSFYVGEGRSRKRVGTFPKLRAARIAAFEVQNEVSFCRVIEKAPGVVEVVESSTLEAIPLGSIAHLVGALDGRSKFGDQLSFQSDVEKLIDEDVLVVAASVKDIQKVSEEHGMDIANDCLGRVGRQILGTLSASARFGQVGVDSICAAVPVKDKDAAMAVAESLHQSLKDQVDDATIGVGWIFKSSKGEDAAPSGINQTRGLIDAALLASFGSGIEGQAREFTPRVLAGSMFRSRQSRDYARVTADFELFSGFGVRSPNIDNQMAMVSYVRPNPNIELAESLFRRAAADPEGSETVKANLACFLIATERASEGFPMLLPLTAPSSYSCALMYGALKTLSEEDFKDFVAQRITSANRALRGSRSWLNSLQISTVSRMLKPLLKAEKEEVEKW